MKTYLYFAVTLMICLILGGCVPLEIRMHGMLPIPVSMSDGDDGFYGQDIPVPEGGWDIEP